MKPEDEKASVTSSLFQVDINANGSSHNPPRANRSVDGLSRRKIHDDRHS